MTNPTEEEVLAALKALGRNYIHVAANLRKLGIKGRPNDPKTCPIAQYLNLKCNTYMPFSVASGYCRTMFIPEIYVDLPKPIVRFIHEYDQRRITLT